MKTFVDARRLWRPLCLLVIGLWVWWPGTQGGFIFDDFPNLVRATAWRAQSLAPRDLWLALQSDISGTVGRALALLSFAVNHALMGGAPYGLKLTNLLWHLANGALVWQLVRGMVTALAESDQHKPEWTATWVTALWLLHPLQASTVLYVIQRMELAAATGILLCLLAYLAARKRQLRGERGWPWLLPAAAAMAFGLGFKETALLSPAFALLLELCLFRFRAAGGRLARGWVAAWLLVVSAGLAGYLYMVLPRLAHWPYATRGWGPAERLLTQGPVLLMYLKQILLPLPESFFFYYDNFPVSTGWDLRTSTAWGTLLTLAAAGVLCWHRFPLTALGIGWFFVGHLLTSNLWPLELAFEHRNYLALLGIILALVQPLGWLTRKLHADARTALALLPILLLATLSHLQAKTWASPLQLAWTLENRNPNSVRAAYGLGQELAREAQGDPATPTWSMAIKEIQHAANLPGDSALPLQALILLPAQVGQPVPETVWHRFREALSHGGMRAEHAGALYAVVQCRIDQKCRFDDNELLRTLLAVVEHNPRSATALTLYANFAWNVIEDHQLAIDLERRAVELAPGASAYRVALAKFLLASGQPDAGQEQLTALEKLNRRGQLDATLAELQQLRQQAVRSGLGAKTQNGDEGATTN